LVSNAHEGLEVKDDEADRKGEGKAREQEHDGKGHASAGNQRAEQAGPQEQGDKLWRREEVVGRAWIHRLLRRPVGVASHTGRRLAMGLVRSR